MPKSIRSLALASGILSGLLAGPALAQQSGGVLRFFHRDSPASASIHEEATISSVAPFMGVFNNLVLFKQDEKQNRLDLIEPELAESWSWNEDDTRLTFKLRQGVKWHDGKPFTAGDVKCTWDLLIGKSADTLRLNPRKAWYRNLDEVATDGDYGVTFVLKRPQPAFLMLLATGMSPVYPCHVAAARHAHPSDRHGTVQIRRIQAQRIHQARQKPGLLEAGPALSRRHRVDDHPEPLDPDLGLHRRQVRHDLSLRGHGAADARHQEPGAGRDLRADPDAGGDQPVGQPRDAALRRPGDPSGDAI